MFWPALTALRRRIRYRVTRGGVLFTLALLLVGAAAAISANNLLFLIVAAMLATMLVSGLVSRLVLAGLELELVLPEHVSARRKSSARLLLRNLKRWLPSFSIRVTGDTMDAPLYFPIIPGGRQLEENVFVVFPKRGVHRDNVFVLATRFPFGFLEKTAMVTLRRETIVYPSVEPEAGLEELLAEVKGDIETWMRGLGSEFYHIRPYVAFESARHVDWKSTAHTGGLQVREFAREQQRTIEIFLDRATGTSAEEKAWFERAVECCAFLAWQLSSQDKGSLLFRSQGFGARMPEESDVYTILKFLALAEPRTGGRCDAPTDESSFQIVLSTEPNRLLEAGWRPAHLLGPEFFPSAALGAEAPGAGTTPHVDHGN